MNKIKLLLPLWLVLLFFGSAAFMIKTRADKNAEYQYYVDTARSYARQEVLADAMDNYRAAFAVRPAIELYIEAGNVYMEYGKYQEAQEWYVNELHQVHPDQVETYEFGMKAYLASDNCRMAFQIYEECLDRELNSETIQELIAPIEYSFDLAGTYEDVYPFGNLSQIAAVKNQDKWGYINVGRNQVLNNVYQSAGIFGDLAAVVDENGEAYFLDQSGNKKITEKSILEKDPEFGQVKQFLGIESGLLWAYNGEIWNCYDAQTFDKICGGYTEATNIVNGIGAVKNKESKWALISSGGEEITDFLYDEVLSDQKAVVCRTDVVIVREGKDYFLVNAKGEKINDVVYEAACAFYDNTLAAVKRNGKWLFIDGTGTEQELGEYERARSFSNGMAAVRKDGKWGYIDREGTLVIDFQFAKAAPFGPSGVAFVIPEEAESWSLLSLYKYNHE